MQVQVFDFRWIDPQHCEIQASAQGKFGKRQISAGQDLSVEIASDVNCAGYWENGWHTCPQKSQGKAKCEICRAREKNFVFTAFDGFDQTHVTDQDLEKVAGAHLVYLALFDQGLIKVGVSNKNRKELRQLEQGSHFTFFIAETPDGISARQIETLLRKGGLADKIKPSQKKDFLCPEMSAEEGEKILHKTFIQHRNALNSHTHLQEFLLEKPEFENWSTYYGLENIRKSNKPFHSVKLEPEESASGKIIAIKGPFLVLEVDAELVALCMKDLYGRQVDFSAKPAGLQVKGAFQSAMF